MTSRTSSCTIRAGLGVAGTPIGRPIAEHPALRARRLPAAGAGRRPGRAVRRRRRRGARLPRPPALTRERFVADPFGGRGSGCTAPVTWRGGGRRRARVPRARRPPGEDPWLPDRARRDRGGAARHPDVAQAAVVAREDAGRRQRLVAYVVPDRRHGAEPRRCARPAASLPDYMVPSAFVRAGSAAADAQRQARPPRAAGAGRRGAESDTGPPRTPQEEILCGLFAEVLGCDGSASTTTSSSSAATRCWRRGWSAGSGRPSASRCRSATSSRRPTVAGLAARLDERRAARPRARYRAPRREPVPLSFAQQRLWFLDRLEDGRERHLQIPLALRLTGSSIVPRCSARSATWWRGTRACARSSPTGGAAAAAGARSRSAVAAATARLRASASATRAGRARRLPPGGGFDLAAELPLRAHLFVPGDGEHVLLLVLHHIAGDGWSMAPLAATWPRLRGARDAAAHQSCRRCRCSTPTTRSGSATCWARDDPDSPIARQLAYWREHARRLPDQLELPTDRPRPAVPSYRGDARAAHAPADAARRACWSWRATASASLFMVLQAALAALLTRLGAGTDIPIGSPIAGRTDEALDDLVGFFVNTLVLRTDTSGDPTFRELSAGCARPISPPTPPGPAVRAAGRGAQPGALAGAAPAVPGDADVPERRRVELATARADAVLEPVSHRQREVRPLAQPGEQRAADGAPAGIAGVLEYATDLFDRATVEAMAARLVRLLEAAVAEPDRPIGRLDLLAARRARTCCWLERRPADDPARHAAGAVRRPGRAHAGRGGGRVRRTRASPTANSTRGPTGWRTTARARRRPRGRGRAVRRALARAWWSRCSASSRPAAPICRSTRDYPAERLAFMLEDAGAPVLHERRGWRRLPRHRCARAARCDGPDDRAEPATRRRSRSMPRALAYVIYTSGSTGEPEGRGGRRTGVVQPVGADATTVRLGPATRAHFPLSLRPLGLEICGALLHGGAGGGAARGELGDRRLLARLVAAAA